VEELSMEETARVLAVTIGTAKVRLHRARMLLQKRLAPELQKTQPAKKSRRLFRSLRERRTV
jgi:RNA polymerase sigma-70 factor (ECF subfamily)